jgi:transcriptional regulator with XRE-family HTH domain
MRDLGRQVRRTRECLGLSQLDIAREARVSQGSVSHLESGRGPAMPFLVVTRINVVLARALRELDPATMSEAARTYLRWVESLGPTDVASSTNGHSGRRGAGRGRRNAQAEEWARIYQQAPPSLQATLFALARAIAEALHQ